MRSLLLKNVKKIHMIGVGGVSMSGLASYLLFNDYCVSGSDVQINDQIENLKNKGLAFFQNHKPENIKDDVDLVVYSGAIKEDNEELIKANQLKIKTMERSEFLGEVAGGFRNTLSVAGTHGKTTTTAYLSYIFMEAKSNPTISIGGNLIGLSNFITGGNEYFICEACEFRESFKYLNSTYAIITNIEADHLDYYKTLSNVKLAFLNFANKVKNKVITYKNDYLKLKLPDKVINCGDNKKYEYSFEIELKNSSGASFKVYNFNKLIGIYKIRQFQDYNIINAFLSVVLAKQFEVSNEIICDALLKFKGVERRNETIGMVSNVPIIADYAHHPTEIEQSLRSSKEIFDKVLCLFQPHTYSRTKSLLNEFKECFRNADQLCFFKTYPARENYDKDGSEKTLFEACLNKDKALFYDENELFSYLKKNVNKFDAVLVLGAGDLYDIMKKMLIK